MLREIVAVLLLCFVVAGPASAAGSLTNAAHEAQRVVAESTRVAQRLELAGTPAERNEAERVLDRGTALLAATETGVGLARLERERLERAMDQLAATLDEARARAIPAAKATTAATITGRIFDAGSTPLVGIPVVLKNPTSPNGNFATTTTDATGNYSFNVAAGTYLLRTNIGTFSPLATVPGYVNMLNAGIVCREGSYCPNYVGDPITVADTATLTVADMHLPRAGGISGRITRASDGTPVGGIVNVFAYAEEGGFTNQATSTAVGSEGTYVFHNLAPGRYRIIADANPGGSGLSDMEWSSPPKRCVTSGIAPINPDYEDCATIPVDFVTVTAGTITANVDLALPAPITFSGNVFDAVSHNPIAGATLVLIADDGLTVLETAPTDAAGFFSFAEIRPSDYRLLISALGYTDLLVGNAAPIAVPSCAGDLVSCDPENLVAAGTIATSVSGASFDLPPTIGASISGYVTRASDGTPVVGVRVAAGNLTGAYAEGVTDATGKYIIDDLPDTTVHIFTLNPASVATTAYPNVPCNGNYCFYAGAAVQVSAAVTVTGLDILAATGGTITGVIRDAATGLPAANNRTRIEIWPIDKTGRDALFGQGGTQSVVQTNGAGFTLSGITPGAYYLTFYSSGRLPLIDQGYFGPNSSIDCPRGGCDMTQLTPIYVTAGGTISGVNAMMPRGKMIKGRILEAVTGKPLPILAYDAAGGFAGNPGVTFNTAIGRPGTFASADESGGYWTATGLGPGIYYGSSYSLRQGLGSTAAQISRGFIDVNYPALTCPAGSCGATAGNAIPVAGADVDNVNFSFSKGGTIKGTVRRSSDAAPLRSVLVDAWNTEGKRVGRNLTNAFGLYTINGVPTGTYYLTTTNDLGYLDEANGNVPCDPFCNPLLSTPVAVTQPSTTTGVDFMLDLASNITGTVTNNGTPVANVGVEVYGALGNLIASTSSRADGTYSALGLSFNRYYVRTRNLVGQIDALYNGGSCVGTACNVRKGTAIDLSGGGNATGINLDLKPPGTINGTVTRSEGGPIASATLQLIDATGTLAAQTTSDVNGAYAFPSLASGSYFVVTRATPGRVDESYNNVPCSISCNGTSGTPIPVGVGATVTADFALSAGATLQGSIKRQSDGTRLFPSVIELYDAQGVAVSRLPASQGNFTLQGVPDGTFYLRSQNTLGFIDEVYNNLSCSGYCDITRGTKIIIAGGASPPLPYDLSLSPGGAFAGTVRASGSLVPLAGVTVQAYDEFGITAGNSMSDASGNYIVSGLLPGRYYLRTLNRNGYVDAVYNGTPTGVTCSPNACSLFAGTALSIGGGTLGPISFVLAPGGTISGTAVDLFNNPLPNGTATLFNAAGAYVAQAAIANGHWEFSNLANGDYYVLIENVVGLVDQLHANVPCPGGACNITGLGTPITLPNGAVPARGTTASAGTEVRLAIGNTISGHVQDSTSSAPLAGVTVYFFNASGVLAGQGVTDALGNYTSEAGFPTGTYYAATTNGIDAGLSDGYIDELFGGAQCPQSCSVVAGTPISVAAAPVVNVDFAVAIGVGFGGTVADANGMPRAQVTITVVAANGSVVGQFVSDSAGHYAASGLPPGTYYARTTNLQGLGDTLFGGAPCVGNCNVLASQPITISVGNEPQDRNFSLVLPNAIYADGFE